MKKRDELIHKEKLEVAATLQAAASAASNVHHHPFSFHHPAVMSHLPWKLVLSFSTHKVGGYALHPVHLESFFWRKNKFFFLFGIIWNCPNKWTVLKTYLASWWYDPWCNIWPKYINIYIYTYIHIYRLLTTTNEWFMAFSASHFALTNFWHKDFLITSWTLSICDAIHTDLHDWYYFKSK